MELKNTLLNNQSQGIQSNSIGQDYSTPSAKGINSEANEVLKNEFQNALLKINSDKTIQNSKIAASGSLGKAEALKFSNHAIERMMSRGISFKPEQLDKLNEAVNRATAKGSKDSLILMDDTALIVSVKNKTVVTVMDKQALKENVFTNIDSTIVM